jgi:DNA (cytosine-5)-methyltransferase 1
VWENVPGAFSSNKGLDFRAVLQEIGSCKIPMLANGKWAENGVAQLPGCEIAWRILDAQWYVPQRRKRIFLVANFSTGKPCAKEILFVEKSLRGNYEKEQCPGQKIAGSVTDGSGTPIVMRMRGGCDGGGKGALLSKNRSLTLAANTNDQVVFEQKSYCIVGNLVDREPRTMNGIGVKEEKSFALNTVDRHAVACESMFTTGWQNVNSNNVVRQQYAVRRLMPIECERLQGLPDNYTLIDDKTCSDSARYKALGNGMAQPCADFVIRRIVEVVRKE